MRIWLALICLITTATCAQAGPVFMALVANGVGVGAAAMASLGAVGTFLAKLAISAAASRLSMILRGKPRQPGITTEVTTTGGVTSQKFFMGLYASGGQMLAPANSYGSAGKTPRAYLVYPIALSVVPGCTLERIIVNDAYVALGSAGAWGRPATGDLASVLCVDYRDGSQTAAHADMLAAFGADPDRPWLADMVGPGLCYGVARFKYDREKFNGLPTVRFEVMGIPLYDPRADSTVGGSGSQRWASKATWTQTSNPVVMVYNIFRGIDVGGGMIWGGECAAEDLPLAGWFAAMNKCDVAVDKPGGGTEPQYRAGIEVALSDEPASVIEELLKTCLGQVVEIGGVWDIQIGEPDLPSYFITDDDLLISEGQSFDPFPPISETFNAITATYPDPVSLWEAKEAPPRYADPWEVEDGGRRLVADLQLPACPYPNQVQRVMTAAIADHRRFRRHQFVLLPEAATLVPLKSIGWTSARWGYTAKAFEIGAITDHLMSMHQGLSVRERDSGDFSWVIGDYIATVAPTSTTTPPVAQGVPGWAVAGEGILDADGLDRRSGIRLSWDADGAEDAAGLQWEMRLAGTVDPQLGGTHSAVASGTVLISEGVVAGQSYEARAQYLVDRATVWSAWEAVTAPNVLVSAPDIAPESIDDSHISSLSADKIRAGLMNARFLEVTEMLEINSVSGAFSLGKQSALDLTNDGIFLGRTDEGSGVVGFGFNVGKTVGGVEQYFQATSQGGLKIVNAQFSVTGAAAPTLVDVTTSQTITLPVGTKLLNLQLLGGGGGGTGATSSSGQVAIAASNGGATTVQLWDGATNTGVAWSSAGALGATTIHGADQGYAGTNSDHGLGGAGGARGNVGGNGGNATGYGAGGGGGGGSEKGGDGGKAAVLISIADHDVSALAAPKLVIVIGAGGAGSAGQDQAGVQFGGDGGAGSPGIVKYAARTATLLSAHLMRDAPTFTGTIVKTAGAVLTFPNFGAGEWELSVTTAVDLDLGLVETHVSGATQRLLLGSHASFRADKTPVDLATSAGAYTVAYRFYKAGAF